MDIDTVEVLANIAAVARVVFFDNASFWSNANFIYSVADIRIVCANSFTRALTHVWTNTSVALVLSA